MLGVGPAKLFESATLFKTMQKLLETADPEMMINEGINLYVNNMMDLNEIYYAEFHTGFSSWTLGRLGLKSLPKAIEEATMRRALHNVQYKFINKIRMALYVIDKFVRLDRVKRARLQMLEELMKDALNEAKNESWKDRIKKQTGSVAIVGGAAILTVPQPDGMAKAESLFGSVGTLTNNLFRSRYHDLQQQNRNVLDAVVSVRK